jgi:acetylornithine deacetylase
MSDVADLLAELIGIDSTNPSLVPGAPGEGALVRALAKRAEKTGLTIDVWEPLPGRPNLVATLPGSGGGPSLMFVGHTDVVGAAPQAYRAEVRGTRMYGRGSNDMKAGLAAAIVAIERLAAGPRLRGDVIFAGVIDEEWLSVGAEDLVRRHKPDAAILPERSDDDVITGHGGFAWYAVESRGVEAAGVEQERGVDGIALLGPVLSGIAALDRALAAKPPGPYGRGSIHASTIHGGDQLPVYPALCELGVERCLIGGESVAQADAEMDDLLTAAGAADPRFVGEWRRVVGREPVALDPAHPMVTALTQAASATLGRPATVRGDLGWMDSGILVEAGVPCSSFGPLGGGEHTAEEWVDLPSVERTVDVLAATARIYCGETEER